MVFGPLFVEEPSAKHRTSLKRIILDLLIVSIGVGLCTSSLLERGAPVNGSSCKHPFIPQGAVAGLRAGKEMPVTALPAKVPDNTKQLNISQNEITYTVCSNSGQCRNQSIAASKKYLEARASSDSQSDSYRLVLASDSNLVTNTELDSDTSSGPSELPFRVNALSNGRSILPRSSVHLDLLKCEKWPTNALSIDLEQRYIQQRPYHRW